MNSFIRSDRKVIRGRLVPIPLEAVLSMDQHNLPCYSVRGKFCRVVYYHTKAELYVDWKLGARMAHFTSHYAIPKNIKEELAKSYAVKVAQSLDQSLKQEQLNTNEVTALIKNLSASFTMSIRGKEE